jgi:phosphatidylinositol glycan class B
VRGWAHPLVFAALFKACAALGIDTHLAITLLPRLVQALCCAGSDVATYVFAGTLFGEPAGRGALFCHLSSWLVFYMGVRTFSTSMEAPLTAAALALWPDWRVGRGGYRQALGFAAAACVIRPTAALFWLPFWLCSLGGAARTRRPRLLAATLAIGVPALSLSTATDSYMYGTLVSVPWRFFSFNVMHSGASAFGTHGLLWYWLSALPMVTATMAPLTLAGAHLARRSAQPLLLAAACFIAALSAIPHKEFRFLLPLLCPACTLAGATLAQLGGFPVQRVATRPHWMPRHKRWFHAACVAVVVPQLLGALYLSLLHQSGPDAALRHLSQAAAAGHIGPGGILMLTPCHETPGYSHLHAPVPLAILDCSPQWRRGAGTADGARVNERDAFFADPVGFLDRRLHGLGGGAPRDVSQGNGEAAWADAVGAAVPPPTGLPSLVVAFDDISALVHDTLTGRWGYRLVHRFFHAHFAVDRDQRELHIYEHQA